MPRVSVASATRATATMYAAVRMSTLFFFCMSRTSLNDFTMTSLSRALIVASRQNRFCRSCTHSKYDTVTPPALHRMSGMRKTPLSLRMRSASGLVGPFAASATIRALMRGALCSPIWFSIAAGMRMSQSSSRSSAFEMRSAPGNPETDPVSRLYASTRFGSRPFALVIAPLVSDRPTIVAPSSAISFAEKLPAFPKPCTTTRAPSRSIPRCLAASMIVYTAPRATVWDPDDGALPGHPHGERLHLAQRHRGVVADPALPGPARGVVLDAVSREHLYDTVGHADGEVHGQLALARREDRAHVGIEMQLLRRDVELFERDLPRIPLGVIADCGALHEILRLMALP